MLVEEAQIPVEIIDAYKIDPEAEISELSGGLVNRTLLVASNTGNVVLQKVSGEINPLAHQDVKVVTDHLYKMKWRVPRLLPVVAGEFMGEFAATDQTNAQWRSSTYVKSDEVPREINLDLVGAAGALISKWHDTASTLRYEPKFGIPNFHDTPFYAAKLRECLRQLDEDNQEIGIELLSIADSSMNLNGSPQVIHGDPKIDNMLFEDGLPFTLIDFDTLMHGSRWTDVGDFLRSAIGRNIREQTNDPAASLEIVGKFMEGYWCQNTLDLSGKAAIEKAKYGTVRIAAELGIRYLCDSVIQRTEQRYFSCNDHIDRAKLQLQVANLVGGATIRDMGGGK